MTPLQTFVAESQYIARVVAQDDDFESAGMLLKASYLMHDTGDVKEGWRLITDARIKSKNRGSRKRIQSLLTKMEKVL